MTETTPKGSKPRKAAAGPSTTGSGEAPVSAGTERGNARSRFNAALEEARAGAALLGAEARERASAYGVQASEGYQAHKPGDHQAEPEQGRNGMNTAFVPSPSDIPATQQDLHQLWVSLATQVEGYRGRELVLMAWSLVFAFGIAVFAAAEPLGLTRLLSSSLFAWLIGMIGVGCLLTVGALLQQFWLSRDSLANIRQRAELEQRLELLNRMQS